MVRVPIYSMRQVWSADTDRPVMNVLLEGLYNVSTSGYNNEDLQKLHALWLAARRTVSLAETRNSC